MLSGLIVYSRDDKEKNIYFIDCCIKRLSEEGFSIVYQDEDYVLDYVKNNKVDFVIYRSRNYQLLVKLESLGIRCFNNSLTNKTANDKYLTYEFLKANNFPCLKSNLSSDKLSLPFVMKSVDGHGGQEVYLINEKNEVESRRKPNKKYIFQEYYPNDGDLRIYVLNKKVIGAVLRENQNDFRSNYSLGGEAKAYKPDQEIVDLAIKVSELLNADYIGVDFLKTNDRWLINEVEDPVGARMLLKASNIDAVNLFIDCICASLKNKSSF